MNRENASTTATVADFIAGLTLPVIEPLASDIEPLLGLPPLPPPENLTFPPAGTPLEPHLGSQRGSQCGSQIEGVRGLMDGYGEAIAAMHRHQNQCAAHIAVTVERLDSLSELEGGLVALDVWQKGGALAQITAELAIILHVGEGAAGRLIEQSVTLVRQLPATMEVLSAGELSWDHAVIIAEETSLLRSAHVTQATIDAFEQRLLEHAANKTPPSFRSTARRLRERSYPETITSRTRHAFAQRSLRVTRGQDGMSWLSLYAPAPTIEAIWDQCHFTAQAARGPHEGRTQTQLRADVAAALLLRQSMDQSGIHSPATVPVPARSHESDDLAASEGTERHPWYLQPEPNPCGEGAFPDPNRRAPNFSPCQIPDFDDPNYNDLAFQEPDRRNQPEWNGTAGLPVLTPAGTSFGTGPGTGAGFLDEATGRPRTYANDMGTWPPLPQVTPIVLIPALSLLGDTNELAWMEGAGPISMEVAKRLASQASSMLRVLVDPISNEPLDIAPDRYRISQSMRTMLRITEEYCQFPGCLAKAITCDVDHIRSFETGGRSIYNNLENLCSRHHLLKHFKDDKDRHGKRRCIDEPERQDVRLRGWTPCVEEDGRVSWTSPSGRYCPPNLQEKHPPAYPKWLKKLIDRAVNRRQQSPEAIPDELRETELAQAFSLALEEAVAAALANAADVEETWDPDNLPEPPAPTPYDEEDDEIRTQMAFETARRNPHLGLPYAA